MLGVSSENAAHRIAVEWDTAGPRRTGVYVPRRDSSSRFNALVGGRLFPGVHHLARFAVRERGNDLEVAFAHRDGTHVEVAARVVGRVPPGSVFGSLEEASEFFAGGALGYSATAREGILDGLELRTLTWKIEPLAVERVTSSFFSDCKLFPEGSVEFDSAFLMRNIEHEWHAHERLCPGAHQEATCAT
jgi:hypothetical protein